MGTGTRVHTHPTISGGIWGLSSEARRAVLSAETQSRSRWIAARTRGGREAEALRNVEAQGYVGWLPRLRDGAVLGLLFPGFLFVLVRRRWISLLGTRGISSLVMSGDQPGRLTEADLCWLREHEDDSGHVVLQEPSRFRGGDEIRVRDGRVHSGVSGLYQCSSACERCWVLLGILGGVRAEIREDDIELACPRL